MNDFPLAPFIISLAADGIRVASDDYGRLALVLQTRGEWNRRQLRAVLLSLLTHTPEQAVVFRQRFDSFFAEDLPLAETIDDEHVQGAVRELLRISSGGFDGAPAGQPAGGSSPTVSETNPPEPVPPGVTKKWRPQESPAPLFTALWEFCRSKLPSKRVNAVLAAATLLALMVTVILPRLRQQPSAVAGEGAVSNTNINNQNKGGTGIQSTPQHTDPNNQNRASNTPTPTPTQSANANNSNRNVAAPDAPHAAAGVSRLQSGYIFVLLAGVALLLAVAVFVRLRMKWGAGSYLSAGEALSFEPGGPDHFPLKKIGGAPSRYLDPAMLDYLSKGLNYFLSENSCRRLDIKATVHASGRNAGLYTPRFHRLKRLVNVYILEDAYATPRAWNPVARELADGLLRRGVSVLYGNFYGSLESFRMEDGETLWFEELECERNESLILFFSDGQRLTHRRDGFLLEALARWPAVAWLDTREKRFWDEHARLIRRFGIPLYQANQDGTKRALERFVTQHHSERENLGESVSWRGVKANTGLPLDEYVEELVGREALAWAQACAMIQPLSPGMADALRREFAPRLSPEHFERLFRLPKSALTASGLYFSQPVLSVLREGFTRSWSTPEQEEILAFIVEEIRKQEPPEKKSLRHLIWRWSLERVRLEFKPDSALEALSRLSETPLHDRIKNDFGQLYLPGEPRRGREKIFLRRPPETARGILHFQHLSGRAVPFSGLSLAEWFRVLWYKAVRTLDALRRAEPQFTLEKVRWLLRETRQLLAGRASAAPAEQTFTTPAVVEERVPRRPVRVLRVRNLSTHFPSDDGIIKAADEVSFDVEPGETLGIVGESGCGKSISALSIMRMVPPPGRIVGGGVWLGDENLLEASEERMREVRGNRIAMIFQDPTTSLNPFHVVGEQIAESLRQHSKLNRQQAREAAIEAMREVAIPDPAVRYKDYPHQLSSGMRQRIMVAMAIACGPEILIADEPTTALDQLTQAQILELLVSLRRTRRLSILLITHDLGLIAGAADRVCVMYTGRVVEQAGVREILSHPRHPYTQGLLGSLAQVMTAKGGESGASLPSIAGTVPALTELPAGCHFAPRCPHRSERCTREPIPLYQVGSRAEVRCVLYEHQSIGLTE